MALNKDDRLIVGDNAELGNSVQKNSKWQEIKEGVLAPHKAILQSDTITETSNRQEPSKATAATQSALSSVI